MAFLVEDGTGLPLANSYSSVAELKAHHLDRGLNLVEFWINSEIQASAIRASDYIDKRFGRRIRGCKRTSTQGLEFPRLDAYYDDDYPFEARPKHLLVAHAEYTLLDLQLTTLTPLPNAPFPSVDPLTGTVTPGLGRLIESRDVVGPIEEQRRYSDAVTDKPVTSSGNLIQSVREYPVADLWMEALLKSSTSRDLGRG